ncbi:MAG: hypothetical protein FJX66_10435 [Alphaproteobacteria bacterium]|nr:hypothetical protein [Alphaproteobacteria bacterium]
MLPAQGLLEPVDDATGVELPPRFAEALEQVRVAIARCDKAGIPNDTLLAALMTELMPRLVQAYGPSGVASSLSQLALELSSAGSRRRTASRARRNT